jgi:hypothetical protein
MRKKKEKKKEEKERKIKKNKEIAVSASDVCARGQNCNV